MIKKFLRLIENLFSSQTSTKNQKTGDTGSIEMKGNRPKISGTDQIKKFEFSATLKLTTPKRILEKHGEVREGPAENLPEYGGKKYGVWTPITNSMPTYQELGIDIDEDRTSKMASQVGYIPTDGGEFLPFLINFREIIESNSLEVDEKIDALNDLKNKSEKYKKFSEKLGPDLALFWYKKQLKKLPNIGNKTAELLYKNGFRTYEEIIDSDIEPLKSLEGIGHKTAESIQKKARELKS